MPVVIETADNPVRNLVMAVHRRLLRHAIAQAAGDGAILAGAMSLAARYLLPQTEHLDGLLAGLMVGAAFAVVRYFSRRPDELTAAIVCDQAAGTPELFSTAWTLPPSGGSDPAWQQTILAHACHALIQVDVNAMLRGRTHPGRLIVGLMLLLSVGLWPGQSSPSSTQRPDTPALSFGRLASMDAEGQMPGRAVWPSALPRPGLSAGETSLTGGPQLLTPADAAAKRDPNARQLGEESGGNASTGRGSGSGLAKGRPPTALDMPRTGRGTPANARAGLTWGDGTTSQTSGNAPATSRGQVITAGSDADGESSVRGNSPAPAGPTATEIASTPAPYRAAVREYFNR